MTQHARLVVLLCVGTALLLKAQDPLKLLPANYTLLFENKSVRVVKVTYAPHEKLPVHDHARNPTVYVYLSDSGPVSFSHAEDYPFSLIRKPLQEGSFRVSPGRIEKHLVENLGDIPTLFLRVELKTIPLGNDSIAFVGHRPFDITKPGITNEFDSNVLIVQRIILAGGSSLHRFTSPAPGLVVAFTPALIQNHRLQHGDILWTPANFDIAPAAPPVHLLRIAPR